MTTMTSPSEDHGLAALTDSDLKIYSVGISTGGTAEIRMAALNRQRHIVATTVDPEGVVFAQERIAAEGYASQIQAKIEDVSKPLPYTDGFFDFIYARLVLHYLPKQTLAPALRELHRVLKPGGSLYVVVRSNDCFDAKRQDSVYDPSTGLTTVTHVNPKTGKTNTSKRFFHSPESIRAYLESAGFTVQYAKEYDEQLSIDFQRTLQPDHTDTLVELMAHA